MLVLQSSDSAFPSPLALPTVKPWCFSKLHIMGSSSQCRSPGPGVWGFREFIIYPLHSFHLWIGMEEGFGSCSIAALPLHPFSIQPSLSLTVEGLFFHQSRSFLELLASCVCRRTLSQWPSIPPSSQNPYPSKKYLVVLAFVYVLKNIPKESNFKD